MYCERGQEVSHRVNGLSVNNSSLCQLLHRQVASHISCAAFQAAHDGCSLLPRVQLDGKDTPDLQVEDPVGKAVPRLAVSSCTVWSPGWRIWDLSQPSSGWLLRLRWPRWDHKGEDPAALRA